MRTRAINRGLPNKSSGQRGRDRVRGNSQLFHKSREKKLAKVARIEFFRTLEINKKLTAIWSALIQEKWLDLIKNRDLCDVLTYSPIF